MRNVITVPGRHRRDSMVTRYPARRLAAVLASCALAAACGAPAPATPAASSAPSPAAPAAPAAAPVASAVPARPEPLDVTVAIPATSLSQFPLALGKQAGIYEQRGI